MLAVTDRNEDLIIHNPGMIYFYIFKLKNFMDKLDISLVPIDDRQRIKDFWAKNSIMVNVKEMLLDTNAEALSNKELKEILSILPNLNGKNILELGSGIG